MVLIAAVTPAASVFLYLPTQPHSNPPDTTFAIDSKSIAMGVAVPKSSCVVNKNSVTLDSISGRLGWCPDTYYYCYYY